jgi:hypothetical protein
VIVTRERLPTSTNSLQGVVAFSQQTVNTIDRYQSCSWRSGIWFDFLSGSKTSNRRRTVIRSGDDNKTTAWRLREIQLYLKI